MLATPTNPPPDAPAERQPPLAAVADSAARIVAEYFRDPIRSLEAVAVDAAVALRAPVQARTLTVAGLDHLVEPLASRLFDLRDVPVYGAGFIAAMDLLVDARGHLSWWQGADRRRLVLAAQTVNKERIDYSELEWFRVPSETRGTHVAGPYVDYLCSDEYTITIAAPVEVDETFAGVAAFDLLIDAVERQLTPQLDALDVDVTLVNGVGRVVVSTEHRHATGDFIRAVEEGSVRAACPGVALDVIATPRR